MRLGCSTPDVGWVVLVGARLMRAAARRGILRDSSTHFHTMIERCRERAASAANPDDQTYWLGLAQIWGKLAERDEQ
jgi:hypothetical protein